MLLAAILCFSSGACNMAAGVASRVGESAIAGGLQLLEQSVGRGGAGLSPGEKRLQRKRGVNPDGRGDQRALAKIKTRTAEVVAELEESSALLLGAGVLSILGGLLAFAASVLLLTEQARAFIIVAMVVAMAGTGLGLLTPFTVGALALLKLLLLGAGVAGALTMRERQDAGQ